MIDGNIAMNSHFENMSEKDMDDMHDHYTGQQPQQLTVKEAIEQGNKLIGEFMGCRMFDKKYPRNHGIGAPEAEWKDMIIQKAKYHRSWDWLMPVAKTIIRLTPLRGKAMSHINQMERVISALMTAEMDKIYFSCIDFIQWYNTQKQ